MINILKNTLDNFLDTQTVTTVIIEVLAILVAFFKFFSIKENRRTHFKKAHNSKCDINKLLIELQNKFKNRNIIPSVAITSNGGGVPRVDTPIYIQALNSTNEEVLELWGNRSLITANMNTTLLELITKNKSSLLVDKFNLKKVESWAGAKHIERVFYFLIGFKKKGVYILAINSETSEELTEEEETFCNIYTNKIKEVFNRNKKFWQEKIV